MVLSLLILMAGTEVGTVCRPSPETSAGTETQFMADTVTLSETNPRARLPLSPMNVARDASLLSFSVLSVQNPKKVPVVVAVGLGDDGAEFKEIGRIALFPPDQPGRFALRVPVEIQKLLGTPGRETRALVIALEGDSVSGADARRVTVGKIAWSRGSEPGPTREP